MIFFITSDEDVASLDTLTYAFGDGKEVSLTKPACNGKFALRAGKVATIATQIGVAAADGSLKDYSNFCSPSQYFGGATGSAPPTDTFAGPITLTIGGKTKNGTFSGTGTATHE